MLPGTLLNAPWTVLNAPGTVLNSLGTVLNPLWTVLNSLGTVLNPLWTVLNPLWTVLNALGTVLNSLWTVLNSLWTVLNALGTVLNSLWTVLNSLWIVLKVSATESIQEAVSKKELPFSVKLQRTAIVIKPFTIGGRQLKFKNCLSQIVFNLHTFVKTFYFYPIGAKRKNQFQKFIFPCFAYCNYLVSKVMGNIY